MTTSDGTVQGATQIFGSAPRNRAFTIALLGDGFTAAQQADFNNACTAFVTALRATPPYDELSPAINVWRINVASTDSGADDPTSGGGTGATARTYFDSSFGGNGIRRLLVCNATTVLTTAAARVPEFSVAIVVVNSTIYGGSGGSVGTYSLAGGATEIAIHEIGHTAYGLADEYPYYAGGNETGHDHHPASEPSEPNVTVNTNRATLKWGWAVAAATSLPTMSNPDCSTVDARPSPVPTGTVGLFEGAHYCRIMSTWWDARGGWAGWFQVSGGVASAGSPITAVVRYSNHMDLFVVGTDNRIYSTWWHDTTGWAGWFNASGGVAKPGSQIAALSRVTEHLDVFVIGSDGFVYSTWWDASGGWAGWFRLGIT